MNEELKDIIYIALDDMGGESIFDTTDHIYNEVIKFIEKGSNE